MDKAKIIIFNGAGEALQEQATDIPVLKAGEILVKNLYTTICGSDLHTYCGLRKEAVPTVLGHEIVGEIQEFSSDHGRKDYLGRTIEIGDRVTWSIFASDPESSKAKAGMPQKAAGLFKYGHATVTSDDALHGGLASHCILKYGTAVLKIDKKVPLKVAATINCAVSTVAGAVRLSGGLRNKKVLISGVGLLGLVCVAMCKINGASEIHVVDLSEERLEQASVFGADFRHLLNQDQSTPKDMDVAFDMSGSPDAMELGLASLTIGGTAVWIGAVFKSRPVEVDAEQVIRRLISIKGLHNYNYEDFVQAVQFIEENYSRFPFESLVSVDYSLEESAAAFEYAVGNKPIRVGINITKKEIHNGA
ncbi:zinc-binding dehydrogenase [Pedobacter sp. MC2016-05]|uniref:zinc-binding dehydrogenase n=1 Tax=Pedobacter sp. MC2016-05 TaxID=2994474 RepID=UPI0022486DCB|nr:zinc-binding dehydrogenase [Pedobacter sp. MC2016-05]MCX2473774.1 zinc-binding dehydrogenase [Pedobacter sp. MC2016-05]